jgi:hypothetical protein
MNFALVMIALLGMFATYLFGFWQGRTSKRSFDLSVTRAVPKVGTSVKVYKRQENPPGFPAFYYMIATIYNEGELPAKQVKGHCKLHSATKSVKENNIPFEREFLGSSPCQLESHRIDDGISGMSVDLEAVSAKNIRLNVDIEFTYFGIPDDKQHRYAATYEYEHKSRQFVRISSQLLPSELEGMPAPLL